MHTKFPTTFIGFTASDLVSLPKNATEQAKYGIKEIYVFFLGGGPLPLLNIANFGSLVNPIVLKEQYGVFKFHIFKQHLQWEKQQQDGLAGALQQLESQKSQETSLGPLLSKRKLSKFEKHIKALEKKVVTLSKQQNYSYKIIMDKCMHNQISECLSENTLSPFGSSNSPVYCRKCTII